MEYRSHAEPPRCLGQDDPDGAHHAGAQAAILRDHRYATWWSPSYIFSVFSCAAEADKTHMPRLDHSHQGVVYLNGGGTQRTAAV